jgi:hypothetical protein
VRTALVFHGRWVGITTWAECLAVERSGLPRYEAGRRARAEELNLTPDHADITDWFRDGTELPPAPAHRRCPSAFAAVVGQTLRLPFPLVIRRLSQFRSNGGTNHVLCDLPLDVRQGFATIRAT